MTIAPTTPPATHDVEGERSPSGSTQEKSAFSHLWQRDREETGDCLPDLLSLVSEQEEEEKTDAPVQAPMFFLQNSASAPPSAAVSAPQTVASVEAQLLFEKMASTMLLLHHEGISETTLILDAPSFAHSPLFGSQITIYEYSSAPKMYNVQLTTSVSGVALMQGALPSLSLSFERGQFPFAVHRLELQLSSGEKPLIHRKEAASEEDKEEEHTQ